MHAACVPCARRSLAVARCVLLSHTLIMLEEEACSLSEACSRRRYAGGGDSALVCSCVLHAELLRTLSLLTSSCSMRFLFVSSFLSRQCPAQARSSSLSLALPSALSLSSGTPK
eukprot:3726543-Rhodomonas_salina.1